MAPLAAGTVAQLRARLEAQDLHPYRFLDGTEKPWEESPAGTDGSLERFLVARRGDIARAEEMYVKHLIWRRRAFPIAREGEVARILDDGRRLSRATVSGDGLPVLLVHLQWGYFLEGTTAFDALSATLVFMEEQIATFGMGGGVQQCAVISYGGPPPMDFAAALASILEANYPERLNRAAVYPVPRFVAALARATIRLLDPGVAAKVSVHSDEAAFLSCMRLTQDQVPPFMHGGMEGAERHMQPDSMGRMNQTVRSGLWRGLRASAGLQESLLCPLEKLPPPLRRRRRPQQLKNHIPAPSSWLFDCCSSRSKACQDDVEVVSGDGADVLVEDIFAGGGLEPRDSPCRQPSWRRVAEVVHKSPAHVVVALGMVTASTVAYVWQGAA